MAVLYSGASALVIAPGPVIARISFLWLLLTSVGAGGSLCARIVGSVMCFASSTTSAVLPVVGLAFPSVRPGQESVAKPS
jgi:hypothetical protein